MKTLALLLLAALSLPAATFYVNIAGLGGEPDYDAALQDVGRRYR